MSAVLLALPVLLWAAVDQLRLVRIGGVISGWGAGLVLTAIAKGLSCSNTQESFASCLSVEGGLLTIAVVAGAILLGVGLIISVRVAADMRTAPH